MASKKKKADKAPTVRWYTPSEGAEMIGVTPQTLRRWAKVGKVQAIKLPSGQSRYNMDDFIRSLGGPRAIQLPPKPAAAKPVAPALQQKQPFRQAPVIPQQIDLIDEINRIAGTGARG